MAELKSHNDKMPIVLCLVFPSSGNEETAPADKIKAINALYAAAVEGRPAGDGHRHLRALRRRQGRRQEGGVPGPAPPECRRLRQVGRLLRPVLATLGFLETADDEFEYEPGAIRLFNGKDLTGWGFREPKTLAAGETFDGKTASSDGRYVAKHGRLIVTTPPEGRRIQQLWTKQEFPKDFTLKLEFRATPNADSGVFVSASRSSSAATIRWPAPTRR